METNNPQIAMQQALLSRASYGGAVPAGWSILASEKLSNGFQAFAYKNAATGQIAVVYAGTNGASDLSSDIDLALQKMPEQYPDAAGFYQRIKDQQGYVSMVSGHSLGGALAQMVGALQDVVAYSFNAPGVHGVLEGMSQAQQKFDGNIPPAESFTQINNYYMGMDPVKARGTQLGNITSYDPSIVEAATIIFSNLIPSGGSLLSAYAAFQQHGIDRLIEAISTPRPTDTIDGYRYNAETKEWSRTGSDGLTEYASADKAAALTGILEQRLTYNSKITEAAALALDFYRASKVVDALSRDYGVPLDLYRMNDPSSSGYFLLNANGDIVAEVQRFDDGSALITTADGRNIAVSDTAPQAGFGATLSNAIGQYGGPLIDALSMLKAIQSGQPLPIATSGLRLATAVDGFDGKIDNLNLAGAAAVGSGILSLMSLDAALQRGDTIAAITAGAQTLGFAASAYVKFAESAGVSAGSMGELSTVLNGNGQSIFAADGLALGNAGVLPYLSIINSLAHGDTMGAAIGVISIAFPPLGIAYGVFSVVNSLFGHSDPPPEPWGGASAGWSGFNTVTNSYGAHGGESTASAYMNQFIAQLDALAAREQVLNPGSPIAVVANRLPSFSYRSYSGFTLTDIDPLTGVQQNVGVRYDLSGRPIGAAPGSEIGAQSFAERFMRVALSRGAIAPLWEAQTAAIQTSHGDPQAGLTEEERAGRAGLLAAIVTGDSQLWRPVALDLNGDGVQTTGNLKTVSFNVDDSGYLKNTAWLNNADGFLFLDRNLNGQLDASRELFSNGMLDISARGLAGLRWVDSNYDGLLNSADPVWSQLKVWTDADGDGQTDAGETQTLSQLGITSLDYAMGRFEQNGALKQLASPDLQADTYGIKTQVVPEGIVVQNTNGQISLLTTHIDDKSLLEANRDGVTSYEDIETIISGADLLANDTLAGWLGQAGNDGLWSLMA